MNTDIHTDKNCDTKDEKAPVCVPFFVHENTMTHYNTANRRMLIALLAVCATFILTIVIFVFCYTVRERNWLNTLTQLQQSVEVSNAVHEQSD